MSHETPLNDYLLLSRGKWDESRSTKEIQHAIDQFYIWYERMVEEGTFKPGQRLSKEGRLVTKSRIVDGPFIESKEVIGGYWFIVAKSLDEAARIASNNPCLALGLEFEVRPVELVRASAYSIANETPPSRAGAR